MASKHRIYTLQVSLTDAPPDASVGKASAATCLIQVRGDQSLHTVFQGMTAAFDRSADGSYEFVFDAGPLHPEGRRYVLPAEFVLDEQSGSPAAGQVGETTLDSLELAAGQGFACYPDGGDDWWYPIVVARIEHKEARGKYPKMIRRSGASPLRADEKPGEARVIGPEAGADTACLVGEVHLDKGEFLRAVEAFTRAIASQPNVDAYEGRSRAYRALADADERSAQALRHPPIRGSK